MPVIARWLALALLLAACATPARASPSPSAPESPSTIPTVTASPTPSPTATAECAARVLAPMTPEQRIGQLFLLGLANDQLGSAETDAIRTYHFGSVCSVEQSRAGAPATAPFPVGFRGPATPATPGSVRFFVARIRRAGSSN